MAAKKRGAAKGSKPYKRANPQREAKTRMYRSRARSEVWTAMLTSRLTHAQLGEKLGDAGCWQIRKWAQGFRRTMPISLACRVASYFRLNLRNMLEPDQISLVEEIQSAQKV